MFSLVIALLLSLSNFRQPQDRMGCQEVDEERKEERMKPKSRELNVHAHILHVILNYKIRDH